MSRYDVNLHNDERIARMVDEPIPEELVSTRSGGGNNVYSYIKGEIDADRMNEIFGPLGWSVSAGTPKIERFEDRRMLKKFVQGQRDKQDVECDVFVYVVTTQTTLTIKARSAESTDTIFCQTGVGYGEVEVGKQAKEAIAMAVKGAETDGFKRCGTLLGRAFGMFLNSTGSQSDIDYAHSSDPNGRKKAHATRNRRAQERRPAAQAEQADARAEAQGSIDNSQAQAPAAPPVQPSTATTGHDKKPTARPRRTPNEAFDLDSEPVTREDQIDWAATLLKMMSETEGDAREAMLRKHISTINQLDGNIRTRLRRVANEHGFDLDKIAA